MNTVNEFGEQCHVSHPNLKNAIYLNLLQNLASCTHMMWENRWKHNKAKKPSQFDDSVVRVHCSDIIELLMNLVHSLSNI